MRLRSHRPDLSQRLTSRLDGLSGDLTDQLAQDIAAAEIQRLTDFLVLVDLEAEQRDGGRL